MGKAYSPEQRERVKLLLEAGRDEEFIEKETGVSDRTIRRWKLELERYGRIGKPPESRTGRHRVIAPEIETVSVGLSVLLVGCVGGEAGGVMLLWQSLICGVTGALRVRCEPPRRLCRRPTVVALRSLQVSCRHAHRATRL